MIIGKNKIKVAMMEINVDTKEVPKIRKDTINATTAKAIPTP